MWSRTRPIGMGVLLMDRWVGEEGRKRRDRGGNRHIIQGNTGINKKDQSGS